MKMPAISFLNIQYEGSNEAKYGEKTTQLPMNGEMLG